MLNYLCAVPATSVEEQKKIAITMIHHIKNSIFGLFFFQIAQYAKFHIMWHSQPKKKPGYNLSRIILVLR